MISRLVLWNVDLTLVDVARVSRGAYADAFRKVTGRPLVALPKIAGRADSEIFFEALALNQAASGPVDAGGQELLADYTRALADAFAARRRALTEQGRLLPGAGEAVAAVAGLPGVVQSVLTGSIRPNAVAKLEAFGLAAHLDLEIGGYGSEVYLKGAQLMDIRSQAAAKYGASGGQGSGGGFSPASTVYLGDSTRDVEAASTGGARCIAVASGRSTASELRAAGASLVIDDLTGTAAVVAAISQLTSPVSAS
ncbi:MAG TPA: haloacid dehalogenase-like hydrolase [Streptosporangiaceae bacterium]|jgi:phosphoglycolate phosphatase-like HAD superfamily hydrolase